MKNHNLKLRKFCLALAALGFLFFVLSAKANAAGASLFLSPASGTYNTGSTFKISVKLESGGATINAAEGTIAFNPDALSVVSISKTNSIFNLWTTEPAFSNSGGNINFGGGTTNNFSGSSGTIATIAFQAKANGKYDIKFSSGSILASDGKGTNILSNMISGTYVIRPQITNPAAGDEEYIPPKNTPKAAVIYSTTHPDQEKWYPNNNPKFSWDLPEDITGVKILYNQNPRSVPVKYSGEAIAEKQLENIGDGIWYFHLELCNKSGCGEASHFKFQIDTKKPQIFGINIESGEKTTNPAPSINFEAKDETSGIDYYQVKIREESWLETREAKYRLPNQAWGKHTMVVRAIDKAGNSTLSISEVEILPLPSPKITDYPKEAVSGSYLSIKGTALPDSPLKIYIQKEDKTEENQAKSDKNGNWSYTYGRSLKTGVYNVWAETADSKGAKSNPSEKVTTIVSPPAYLKIGRLIIDYLTISLVLLGLILVIIFALIWAWGAVRQKMRKIGKETTKLEKSLLKAFKHLEKKVKKEVAKIDGNPKLNKREKKVSENLRAALRSAEKYIGKEIKDIENELK